MICFKNWQQEQDIPKVCRQLLDNADLDYTIDANPLAIYLTFYVMGSDISVHFECRNITKFSYGQDVDDIADEHCLGLVLSVTLVQLNVNEDLKTILHIMPTPELSIECLSYNWYLKHSEVDFRTK